MGCFCISTGELRHLVRVEKQSLTSDQIGGNTVTWDLRYEMWAKIEPVSASQRWQAMKLNHEVTHKIIMRYKSDIVSSDRIVFETREFHIQGITDPEERHKFLIIMAKEGAPS